MATFYAKGKVDSTILVDDFGNTRIIKNCLSHMFGFQHDSIHVSRNDVYNDNSVVKNSIYHEYISKHIGVHWDVMARRYKIVGDNLIQCSQGTILTPGIAASMANVAPEAFVVKQEALDKEDTLVSSSHFLSSTFIDLSNFYNKDVSLLVSFDVNVFGSFPLLILDVYIMESVLSNLNQIQGQSFEILIDYLKAMFVTPHPLNKLKSLDYNKIKV
jgi:hypothetical protein